MPLHTGPRPPPADRPRSALPLDASQHRVRSTYALGFLERLVGLRLSPAQRVFALTLDGRRVATDDERATFAELFGLDADAYHALPTETRRLVLLLKGARCGGTLLCASFGLYRALTADLSQLRAGERTFVAFTGADVRHAREALAQAATTIDRNPEIAACVVSRSTEKIELRRADDRVAVLQVLPATPSAPRGRWFAAVVVTEADYLGTSDGAAPAEEVVRAYAARLTRGSTLLAETTPWLDGGYWHKTYSANFGAPTTAVVCRAPTLLFYPTDETRELVAAETRRDPMNAAREYACAWIAGSTFFDADAVARAVDHARPPSLAPSRGAAVGVGIDLAMRSDASALVVVTERTAGVVDVAHVEVMRPERGRPLVPSDVLRRFASVAASYGATLACGDGHYIETASEILGAEGIEVTAVGMSAQSKVAMFMHLRDLVHSSRLRLPPSGPLAEELRAVVSRNVQGGAIRIESPRRQGSHGDTVSALAAAAHALTIGGGFANAFDGIPVTLPIFRSIY